MTRITVRINQLDLAQAEPESAWPSAGPQAGVRGPWPGDTRAFEVLIVGVDEHSRAISDGFRHEQLRRMIPQVVMALRDPGEELVVRLDGPLADRELMPAYRWLVDPIERTGRFACSPIRKLEHPAEDVLASVRVQPSIRQLAAICGDGSVGLERSVRLRIASVPEQLIGQVLSLDQPDDPAWAAIVAEAGFMLSTSRGLRSLQVLTHRLDAAAIKGRIMQRLLHPSTASALEATRQPSFPIGK